MKLKARKLYSAYDRHYSYSFLWYDKVLTEGVYTIVYVAKDRTVRYTKLYIQFDSMLERLFLYTKTPTGSPYPREDFDYLNTDIIGILKAT